ncbi:MAG: hypothetical protein PVI21_00075 [Candidatus Woesebacteria bacterium]
MTCFVSALFAPIAAYAQDVTWLSGNQLEEVKSNCIATQNVLSKLQKRDAVSRINRGRAYDLLARQIIAFDDRLSYNKIDLPKVQQLGSDYQKGVDSFRELYYTYDNLLTDAIKMDCKATPQEFYNIIQSARTARSSIGVQIAKLEDVTTAYRAEIVKYQNTLQNGVSQ